MIRVEIVKEVIHPVKNLSSLLAPSTCRRSLLRDREPSREVAAARLQIEEKAA